MGRKNYRLVILEIGCYIGSRDNKDLFWGGGVGMERKKIG